jgi:hypothetical protein
VARSLVKVQSSRFCAGGPHPPAVVYQNDTGGEAFEPDGSAAATATTSIMDRKPDALIA